MKILDYQGLTLGHPALDIWSIVYSATDAEYRASHLEDDLRAYYTVLAGYMDTTVDYTEFRQELEERRVMGMVMYGRITCCLLLSNLFLLRHILRDHPESDPDAEPSEGTIQVRGGLPGNTKGGGYS